MRDLDSAPSAVVGVDGSQAATQAVQLLLTGVTYQRRYLGAPERVECFVLTVRGNHL
jgi:hypothetical protein